MKSNRNMESGMPSDSSAGRPGVACPQVALPRQRSGDDPASNARRLAPARSGPAWNGLHGRVHSRAWAHLPQLEARPAAQPVLAAICGQNVQRAQSVAQRYGWPRVSDDWSELARDPDVAIFDNAAPNHLHAEPTVVAARAGKHVICEKPLGRTEAEARVLLETVRSAGITHMCAFNYRFFPAIHLA